MPSGERIQFANNVNFIFECHSLQYASPATVSRCGMLLMSDEHNGANNMLTTWLDKQPAQQAGEPDVYSSVKWYIVCIRVHMMLFIAALTQQNCSQMLSAIVFCKQMHLRDQASRSQC